MDGRFNNPFVSEQEDPGFMLDISDSPPYSNGERVYQTPLPKRSKRAVQKRVVSVPIGDSDGCRIKGEGAPPSDSWAWRKYGQKPIKGSPYPRGYYRCSSSKGCPARKQVERSRVDPTMIVITYASDHNHSWPTSKITSTTTITTAIPIVSQLEKSLAHEPKSFLTRPKPEVKIEPDIQFSDLVDDPLINDFSWFSDVASTSPILESIIFSQNSEEADMAAMIFPMGAEDELLFADLGELPECSVVFRRGFVEKEVEHRRCNLTPSLCESTG